MRFVKIPLSRNASIELAGFTSFYSDSYMVHNQDTSLIEIIKA